MATSIVLDIGILEIGIGELDIGELAGKVPKSTDRSMALTIIKI